DGELARPDVLALIASVDGFVSLHRAEGLGLVPLEAMALGKPVVATAWSGNLDFMTPDNSMLVPARQVPVAGADAGAYRADRIGEGQTWANPDLRAAAAALRQLAESAIFRAQLGGRARASALEYSAVARRGAAFDTLREAVAGRQAGIPPA